MGEDSGFLSVITNAAGYAVSKLYAPHAGFYLMQTIFTRHEDLKIAVNQQA